MRTHSSEEEHWSFKPLVPGSSPLEGTNYRWNMKVLARLNQPDFQLTLSYEEMGEFFTFLEDHKDRYKGWDTLENMHKELSENKYIPYSKPCRFRDRDLKPKKINEYWSNFYPGTTGLCRFHNSYERAKENIRTSGNTLAYTLHIYQTSDQVWHIERSENP